MTSTITIAKETTWEVIPQTMSELEDLANLKVRPLKGSLGSRKKKNKEKWTEPKGSVAHHQYKRRAHKEYLKKQWPKNAPKSRKNMNLQIQASQWTLSSINSKRPTLRHIVKKLSEDKEFWKQQMTHCHVQRKLNKTDSQLLSRNYRGQK